MIELNFAPENACKLLSFIFSAFRCFYDFNMNNQNESIQTSSIKPTYLMNPPPSTNVRLVYVYTLLGSRGRRACGWALRFLIMRDLIKSWLLLFKAPLFRTRHRESKRFQRNWKSVKPFEKSILKIAIGTLRGRKKLFQKVSLDFDDLIIETDGRGSLARHMSVSGKRIPIIPYTCQGFLNEARKTQNDSNWMKLFSLQWGREIKFLPHSKRENFLFLEHWKSVSHIRVENISPR